MSEPVDPLPAVYESCDSLSPERLELARRAFGFRANGKTQAEVAEEMGISRSTVVRLLIEYRASYAKSLSETPILHLIAAEVARIEEFEETCRRKADEAICPKIKTGYLRLALQAINTRHELLLATGVIPKEPEKVYSIMHSTSRDLREEARTEDQIRTEILRLIKHGRRL